MDGCLVTAGVRALTIENPFYEVLVCTWPKLQGLRCRDPLGPLRIPSPVGPTGNLAQANAGVNDAIEQIDNQVYENVH